MFTSFCSEDDLFNYFEELDCECGKIYDIDASVSSYIESETEQVIE